MKVLATMLVLLAVAAARPAATHTSRGCEYATPEPTTLEPTLPPVLSPLEYNTLYNAPLAATLFRYTLPQCSTLCMNTRGCTAFTHRKTDLERCTLHGGRPPFSKTPLTGATSAVVVSPKPCLLLPTGTLVAGPTVTQFAVVAIEKCCMECALLVAGCVGYTFDATSRVCTLKSAITGNSTSAGWVSGLN